MKKVFISEDLLNKLVNVPIKIRITGGYWIIHRDKTGKLQVERWSSHTEDHNQDHYEGSNCVMNFYPHSEFKFSGEPCVLYLNGKHVRQYSIYRSRVREVLKVDEIYPTVWRTYKGWEVNYPDNRVHSEIVCINKNGSFRKINTSKYMGEYEVDVSDAEVLIVDYTNTGKNSSKFCIYCKGDDALKKHAKTVINMVQLLRK